MFRKNFIFYIVALMLMLCLFAACTRTEGPTNPSDTTITTTEKVTEPEEKLFYTKEHTIWYNSDGSTTEASSIYTYDEKGLLLEQVDCDNNSSVVNRYEYSYDEGGTLISEVAYIDGVVYQYDEHGNLTSEITYNPDGSIQSSKTTIYTYEYTYYPDGRVCTVRGYTDSVEGWCFYKGYDLLGHLVKAIYCGEHTINIQYKYKDGVCVYSNEKIDYYTPNCEKYFDINGNLTKMSVYNQQTCHILYDDLYEYDDHNNCTSVVRRYENGTTTQLSRTEYTYDEGLRIKSKVGYNEDGSVLYNTIYSYSTTIPQAD